MIHDYEIEDLKEEINIIREVLKEELNVDVSKYYYIHDNMNVKRLRRSIK